MATPWLSVLAASLLVVAPACDERQCTTSFDCIPGAPTCDTTENVCVAGPSECAGDDANDDGDADDGPSSATVLTAPAPGAPTIVTGAICSEPATEQDWYRIHLSQSVRISLTYEGVDLDLSLYDEPGSFTSSTESSSSERRIVTTAYIRGDHYLVVTPVTPIAGTAVSYTLTIDIPECVPTDEWWLTACPTSAEPWCSAGGDCSDGQMCSDDYGGEPNDDGPAGARLLDVGPINAGICSSSDLVREFDYYKFDVTAGAGKKITLDWTPTLPDDPGTLVSMDLYVLDPSGTRVGVSLDGPFTNSRPRMITLTSEGTYYAKVVRIGAVNNHLEALPYTITATSQPLE